MAAIPSWLRKKIWWIIFLICPVSQNFNAFSQSNDVKTVIEPRTDSRVIPSPDCSLFFFYKTTSEKKGLIGVKNDHGVVIWRKPISINSFFSTWSRDGRFIALSVDKPYYFTSSKKENFCYIFESSTGRSVN
ncbi:MAG: hypothetical protein FJX18_05175 [Alphaproteobacteria bacterium]|nr:hypothetical protein [Alphaproteobacteria bacterium]